MAEIIKKFPKGTFEESQAALKALASTLEEAKLPWPISQFDKLLSLTSLQDHAKNIGSSITDEDSLDASKKIFMVFLDRFRSLVDAVGRAIAQLSSAKTSRESWHRAEMKKEMAAKERLARREAEKNRKRSMQEAAAAAQAAMESPQACRTPPKRRCDATNVIVDMMLPEGEAYDIKTIKFGDLAECQEDLDFDKPYIIQDIAWLKDSFSFGRDLRVGLQMFMAGFENSALAKARGRSHGDVTALSSTVAELFHLFPASRITDLGKKQFNGTLKAVHMFGYISSMRMFGLESNGLPALRLTTKGKRRITVVVMSTIVTALEKVGRKPSNGTKFDVEDCERLLNKELDQHFFQQLIDNGMLVQCGLISSNTCV